MPCTGLEEPKTLMKCLQLLASLSKNPDVKNKVITELKSNEYLNKYCGQEYLTSSFGQQYLTTTFNNADKLLGHILPSGTEGFNKYGDYDKLDEEHKNCDHVHKSLSSGILFQVYAALYFLYFNVNNNVFSVTLAAGTWSNLMLNQTSNNPAKWLMGQSGLTPELMDRGFQPGHLKDSTSKGADLGRKLNQLVHHQTPMALQSTLAALLFLGPWHDSKLGHAFVFFKEFCEQFGKTDQNALKDKFTELQLPGTYDNFKTVCSNLHGTVKRFVDGINESIVQPVCWTTTALYSFIDQTMSAAQFGAYVLWLKENLEGLMSSLEGMLNHSGKWEPSKLNNAQTAGPFRYGFVPKQNANNWDSIKRSLASEIDELTGALPCLLIALLSPLTLRTSLQLCAKLHSLADLKSKVIDKLKIDLKKYCNPSYLTQFGMVTGRGYLESVFSGANMLIGQMLQNGSDSVKYGLYSKLDSTHASCNCAECIPHYLKEYLPQVYAALYFLYFETENSMGLASGKWKDHYINHTDKNPGMWLTGPNLTPELMPRGFQQSELKSTQAWGFDASIKQLIKHDNITSSAYLQRVLLGLLFLGHWHESKLGHTLCFLDYFCSKVTEQAEDLRSHYDNASWSIFHSECQGLGSSLQSSFIGTSAASGISAVCWQNSALYSNVLGQAMTTEKFKEYTEWLKQKDVQDRTVLDKIIMSLTKMKSDADQWDSADKLEKASTAGPFKYGFVFKSGWTGTSSEIQLQDPVTKLNESLKTLKSRLEGLQPKAQEEGEGKEGKKAEQAETSEEHDVSGSPSGDGTSSGGSTGTGGAGQEGPSGTRSTGVQEENDQDEGQGVNSNSIISTYVGGLGGTAGVLGIGGVSWYMLKRVRGL